MQQNKQIKKSKDQNDLFFYIMQFSPTTIIIMLVRFEQQAGLKTIQSNTQVTRLIFKCKM